jgi:hypothetical protein
MKNIFQSIRETEETSQGPLTRFLGLESMNPNHILKDDMTVYYKIVDEKKHLFAKLKYGF